jgi:protocatechuate 3,4-dioxygenase beta subunit
MTATEPTTLTATPTQIEGPYYKVASPHRASLIEPGVSGIPFTITGRMLTTEGKPVPGGILDFWQSDDVGNYEMSNYRLRGHVFTDEEGRYSIETIYPACYEPRDARHIHVKFQGVSRPHTTQLYFSDDENRVKDHFYTTDLEVQVEDLPDGSKRGTFDFVIQQVTEKENVTPESLAARV